MLTPRFHISLNAGKALTEIETCRAHVSDLPLPLPLRESLRLDARLAATHFSTQISGNRLSREQLDKAVLHGLSIPDRVRDTQQARNYFLALEYVDGLVRSSQSLTEEQLRLLHALLMTGKREPRPYRDGQNAVRDSASGVIVHMSPDAKDVPGLIEDLLAWIDSELESEELPVPIMVGLAHYQLAAIHPWYDGNGRATRLFARLLLQKTAYDLGGLCTLEEYYAQNLGALNQSLRFSASRQYRLDQQEMQLSVWIEYFCMGLADASSAARDLAVSKLRQPQSKPDSRPGKLDARQRQVRALFDVEPYITTKQIADLLGLHRRTALNLCNEWVTTGFLVQFGEARKSRRYELGARYASDTEAAP